MKRRFKLPFLHKLLLTYLFALLLPIALMGQQTWNGYQKTLEQEIIQTNGQLLADFSSVISLKMYELEQIAINLDINPQLRPFAVTATPYGTVRAIQSLAQYRSTNTFIYEIGYYIRGRDYLYTSLAAYPIEQFLQNFFERPDLSDEQLKDLLENSRYPVILPSSNTLFVRSDARLMIFIYPLPAAGEPYATAVFFIDEEKINSMLQSVFNRKNDSIFMLDNNGTVLLSLPLNQELPDLTALIDEITAKGQSTKQDIHSAVLPVCGTDSVVTYIEGGYRGTQFLAISPLDEIMAPAIQQQRRFFITLGIVALVGLSVIVLSLSVTYTPLRHLFYKVRAYQDDPFGRGNEIQLIGRMLDQIQDDNRRMREIIKESASDVRTAFLFDLISGLVDDELVLQQRANLAGICLYGEAYAALALLIENDGALERQCENRENELIMSEGVRFYLTRPMGDRIVPVVAILNSNDPDLYSNAIHTLRQFIESKNMVATIGVGALEETPKNIATSWQQAVEALSHRFVEGKGSTLIYEDLKQKTHILPWYPNQEIDDLIRGISSGQKDMIKEAIDSVLQQISVRNLGIFAARCLCYDLINTVVRVVVSQNVKIDVVEEQLADMIRLPQTETIQQLGDYLVTFCTRLSEQMCKTHDHRLEKMLTYLNEHIHDSDFSVYKMADELNISYSYLNRIFSQATGKTVLDYLTDRRLQWVKQQLRETDRPIKDIILEAGYNDIPNFSRKFKQREGISPRQYREKYRLSDNEEK